MTRPGGLVQRRLKALSKSGQYRGTKQRSRQTQLLSGAAQLLCKSASKEEAWGAARVDICLDKNTFVVHKARQRVVHAAAGGQSAQAFQPPPRT